MEIEVVETIKTEQGFQEIRKIIDESVFLRLYGEDDFKILKHNGQVGDVIGQGKTYRAKILTAKQVFEDAKKEYLKTKTEYDELYAKLVEANKPIHNALEQGKISVDEWAWKTTDNEFELGFVDAQERLIKAGSRLIAAGRAYLEEKLTEEQKENIKVVWDCKFHSVREKLINLLLRLE